MSYVRLNICDRFQTVSGEVHGYFVDAVVAALTAEPETVEELGLALARFIKPQSDSSPFVGFHVCENFESYDAGIVVIDLAARVVAVDSSYSQPSAEGRFRVQSDFSDDDALVPYRLSDEWLFVYTILEYEGVRKRRREARVAVQPLDAREVLYGRALLEFIARECFEARNSTDEALFTKLHAKWLMTARDDLCGATPRDILLEKQDFIDFDLQWRELQWSITKECPPPLPINSNAFRYSGFGTHEAVVYYDLVRYLLGECFEGLKADGSVDAEIVRLEQLKAAWLSTPSEEGSERTPSNIIECERKRVNLIMSAKEFVIDEDCDICQAMAEDFDTPVFMQLDGSNMDEGFEFSFDKTREEYEEKEREREEFNRQFDRDLKQGKYNKPFDESLIDFEGEPPF